MHSVFMATIITTGEMLNLQQAWLVQAGCRRDQFSRGRGTSAIGVGLRVGPSSEN